VRVVELQIADEPDAWRRAGFTVDEGGVAVVGEVALRCIGRPADQPGGIVGWTLTGLDDGVTVIDGLATRPGSGDGARDSVWHPNTTTSVDHVVIATPDVDRTVAAFGALGVPLRRERAATAGRRMRQAFLRAGEAILEIVGPPEAQRDHPASFWGLACTVTDLDACVTLLGDVVGTPRDAVQRGRRIVTLRHDAIGVSVPTAFMSA
jgi:hypothetical protein